MLIVAAPLRLYRQPAAIIARNIECSIRRPTRVESRLASCGKQKELRAEPFDGMAGRKARWNAHGQRGLSSSNILGVSQAPRWVLVQRPRAILIYCSDHRLRSSADPTRRTGSASPAWQQPEILFPSSLPPPPSLVPLVLPPRNDRPSPSSPSPLPLSVDSPPEPPCGPQLTGSTQGQGLRAQKANSVVVCESTCPHLHRQHWSHDRQRARQPLACPQTRWGLASLPWLAVLGQSARGGRAR